jgi:hypothetical protein
MPPGPSGGKHAATIISTLSPELLLDCTSRPSRRLPGRAEKQRSGHSIAWARSRVSEPYTAIKNESGRARTLSDNPAAFARATESEVGAEMVTSIGH